MSESEYSTNYPDGYQPAEEPTDNNVSNISKFDINKEKTTELFNQLVLSFAKIAYHYSVKYCTGNTFESVKFKQYLKDLISYYCK